MQSVVSTTRTEALPVQNKGDQDVCVVMPVADMVRGTGPQRLIFQSNQEPSILELKNKTVAELGGSYSVTLEASPANEH